MKRRNFLGTAGGLAMAVPGLAVQSINTPPHLYVNLPWSDAARNLLTAAETNAGVCLLEIDHDSTGISVLLADRCLAREQLQPGSQAIVAAVAQACSLAPQAAAAAIAKTPLRRDLALALQRELERLFLSTREYLHGTATYLRLAHGVVVTGHFAAVAGMVELGEEVFHFQVRTVANDQPGVTVRR